MAEPRGKGDDATTQPGTPRDADAASLDRTQLSAARRPDPANLERTQLSAKRGDAARASDPGAATQLHDPQPTDGGAPTQLTEKGEATRVAGAGSGSGADHLHAPVDRADRHVLRDLSVEQELLHEMKRIHHQLSHFTTGYRRYTLSFVSGIVRGLGAALGATVVFALLLAALSHLDTTPIIGNYVRQIVSIVKQSGPNGGAGFLPPSPLETPAATDAAPEASATATAAPASTSAAATGDALPGSPAAAATAATAH